MAAISFEDCWRKWGNFVDIKFLLSPKEKRLECWHNGKRIHQIISKSHWEEVKEVSGMTHLEDLAAYAKYLKSEDFWEVDLTGLAYEIFYKKTLDKS